MASTTQVELENLETPSRPSPTKQNAPDTQVWGDGRLLGETGGVEPDPTPRVEALQKWNDPNGNAYRMAAVFASFFLMGCNDSAYGPLIPYVSLHTYYKIAPTDILQLEEYYSISHTIVSLVFLSPFVGYVASALLNNYLHLKFGQRGISVISSSCHLAAYCVICAHPPYVALVFAFILAGFGNGLSDAAFNAWVGSLANSSELLGLIHAFYGLGGVMTPLVATSFITRLGMEWYTFYYLMVRHTPPIVGV